MGFAEDYAREQEERQRQLRLRVAADLNHNPDVAARVFGVAAKTKLPSDVVAADLEGLETQLKRQSFNYDNYTDAKNGSPIFNKFAAEDPYNYAVLERDRKSMTAFERAVNPIALGWEAGWGTTRIADIQDRRIKGDKRDSDAEELKELRLLVGGGHFGADNKLSKLLVGTAKQLPIMGTIAYESLDETLGGAIAGGTAALIAGQAGPQALAPEELITVPGTAMIGAGIGAATGSSMATFKLERGLAYDEYLEMGINEKDALTMANMVGAINAPLEMIGLGAVTKRIPGIRRLQNDVSGEIVAKIFNTPTFKAGLARATVQYGEGVATEIVTEILQESSLMAGREYLKSQERAAGNLDPTFAPMTGDEFGKAIQQIAVETMYGVGLIGAAGPIMNFRADANRAANARRQQQAWKALGESVDESETRKSAPDAWSEFVARVKKDGPLKEVRIDAEGFKTYFQSKQIDPEEAARQLGIDLNEQGATDVDVVIPFDVYVDKIAPTEHHGGLMKDLRVREGEMTLRESEEWYKEKDAAIERLEASLAAEFDRTIETEITEDLTGQLIASGYVRPAAERMAKLHAAITTVTAARAGVDPMALYRERLAGVRKKLPDALAGEDVDMTMDPILDRIRNKDFPTQREIFGESLIDLFRSVGGIQDQGTELSSRDFGKQFVGVISKSGKTIDEMAGIAFDRGFIAAHDESLLMDAIDRELDDTQVFSRSAKINTDLQNLLGQLESAEQFLDEEQIDLNTMSNQEVRERLSGIKRLEQSEDSELADLRAQIEQASKNDPELLAKLMLQMPRVAEKQDFSSITFTDKFVDERGKKGTIKQNAQKAYNAAVKERNLLKRLLECVNG